MALPLGVQEMSVTQRKSDLRDIIHRMIEAHLNEHPDSAHDVAMGAIRRLSATMTLGKLEDWHTALCLSVDKEPS